MGKYGDINNDQTVTEADLTIMFEYITGTATTPDPLVSDETSRKFFCMNMDKKWAYSGPALRDLVMLNQARTGFRDLEDFWQADYNNNDGPAWDSPESGKGSCIAQDGDRFVASFPTLIDYASWSGPELILGQETDYRETGGARMYTKSGQYEASFNILPPTELYKTRTFKKSDFGLYSIALAGDFMATSTYLHGEEGETPTTGSVFVYHRLPDGNYIFRHEIEVTDTSKAPVVEIHGDWLFVGNPINHIVMVYSLSSFETYHSPKTKSVAPPVQLLSPTTIQGQPVTDWYGSCLHCSDGQHLFVGVDNGRLQQNDVLTGNYTVDCGYVDVYKLREGTWEYVARITPPDLAIFQNNDSYGVDSADIQFGGSVYHRKHDTTGDEYVAIGAPRADTDLSHRGSDYIWDDNRMEGSVYIVKMTTVDDTPVFQHVHKESYQDAWFGSNSVVQGEFEFGRSVVFDADFNLWIASNPPAGSHITRIPKLALTSWDTANASSTLISSDRVGGVLTTNGQDVIYGGPFKLRVFQSPSSDEVQTLKSPETPPTPTSGGPEYISNSINDHISESVPETKLNREFPSEWGAPPSNETRDLVQLPFGYGMGSTTLSNWIFDNSTGDMSSTRYLRHVDNKKSSTDDVDYHELWKTGNPTIQVRITSNIGGSVSIQTPQETMRAVESQMARYKSDTRSTVVLLAECDSHGVSVNWVVNGKRASGNLRLELLVCGEDMDVEVNFSKQTFAQNDTPTLCAMTRSGVTTIINKAEL